MVDLSIIDNQYWELIDRYPELRLEYLGGENRIIGKLKFSANFQYQRIDDEYVVEVIIPDSYPYSLPIVREKGNKIPRDFHKYRDDSLCLGASLAIKLKFAKQPTLLGFIENCVIPYLYSYSYKCTYGFLPFGELSHGWLGVLEYYKDLFDINDERIILRLLKILVHNNYKAHSRCPCGSRKRIRDCHGNFLKKLMPLQPTMSYFEDYQTILEGLKKNNHIPKAME